MILYAPHLGRDISGLLAAVPGAMVIEGARTPIGADGCLQMHRQAILDAREAGAPMVFVMEDDCQFTSHFNWPRWQLDAAWARRRHFDVLVGGSVGAYFPRVVRRGMVGVKAFHSCHCVVYMDSGYDKVLAAGQPLDKSIGWEQGARCVLAVPFVAVQAPSFSGILQRKVDYVPYYEAYERDLTMTLKVGRGRQ